MKKSLLTLSFGTFGLGISEFVMMGILPMVAHDFGVSIPSAGFLISAYALGVCVGAPLTVLVARNYPLKKILLALVALYALGNLMAAAAPSFASILLMRFVSGLPHGAFFGVGSIVAERLADKGKTASALSLMIAGMTVANLAGVPLGTFLANVLSWRLIFLLTGIWGAFNIWAMWHWLPQMEALPNNGLKGQFAFMKNLSPWLIIGATAFANGGIFCMYSYVSPLLTDIAGFRPADISWIMVLCGLAMVTGNMIGGKLSDKHSMSLVLASIQGIAAMLMVVLFFGASLKLLALILILLISASLFGVSSPVQLLILQNSRGGEMMGAALIQIAFNLGNAIGAWNGGIVIKTGHTENYTALIGSLYLVAACSLVLLYHFRQPRQLATCPIRASH